LRETGLPEVNLGNKSQKSSKLENKLLNTKCKRNTNKDAKILENLSIPVESQPNINNTINFSVNINATFGEGGCNAGSHCQFNNLPCNSNNGLPAIKETINIQKDNNNNIEEKLQNAPMNIFNNILTNILSNNYSNNICNQTLNNEQKLTNQKENSLVSLMNQLSGLENLLINTKCELQKFDNLKVNFYGALNNLPYQIGAFPPLNQDNKLNDANKN